MIVKRDQSVKYQNGPACVAYEYPTGTDNINIALIKITGRYPDKGLVWNEEVTELIYVVSGQGKFVLEGREYKLEEGDTVSIPPKQKYFFDGTLELVISCSPAWHPEQYRHLG